jgi:hypothetical protein
MSTQKHSDRPQENTVRRSSTDTLVKALRIIARDMKTSEGLFEAALLEAAGRLQELDARLKDLNTRIERRAS